MLGQRVREARDARERRRRGADEDQHARDPHRNLERVHENPRERTFERRRDAHERRLQPFLSERRLAARHGVGGKTDRADEHGHDHDEADRGEERSRQRATRLGRLLREVRDGLEARVREHRERQRESEVAPVLVSPRSRVRRRAPPARAGVRSRAARERPGRAGRAAQRRARRDGGACGERSVRLRWRRRAGSRRRHPTATLEATTGRPRRRGSAARRARRAP